VALSGNQIKNDLSTKDYSSQITKLQEPPDPALVRRNTTGCSVTYHGELLNSPGDSKHPCKER
jgi:hypothetical protein